MKRTSLAALVAAWLVAAAAPLAAQTVDPTGTWDLVFNTQQGPIGAQLIVTKEGDRFGGTIASEMGQVPIEAAVKGNAITVGFTMSTPGGDLGVTLNATITGDEIKGTFDAGGSGGGDFSGRRTAKDKQAAAEAPAEKVDLTGVWNVQVTTDTISASPLVTLKQDGEKLTGDYESAQYGKFPLTGTVKDGKVEFGCAMTIEGNSITVSFSGTADKDGMKGTVSYGDFASGSFTATRRK